MKQIPIRRLLKRADAVFSVWIRARDRRCVTCGATVKLQCSHLIRRGKHSVRFSEVNCHTQCSSCNWKHNYFPEKYTSWLLSTHGELAYLTLVKDAMKLKSWKRYELESIVEKYKLPLEKEIVDEILHNREIVKRGIDWKKFWNDYSKRRTVHDIDAGAVQSLIEEQLKG